MYPNASEKNNQTGDLGRRSSLFSRSSTMGSSSPLRLALFGGSNNENNTGLNSSSQTKTFGGRANDPSICLRCKRFEADLTNTSDDLSAIDAELKASRQVISLLQRQLELLRVQKESLEKLIVLSTARQSTQSENLDQDSSLNDTQHILKIIQNEIYAKDEEIVELKFNLNQSNNEKEQLKQKLHLQGEEISELKTNNIVLKENLSLRDQTIVSLSNEVFEQGNLDCFISKNPRQIGGDTSTGGQQSLQKAQQKIHKLNDSLEAYKKTNELLNTNVIKLTDRCTQAENQEIEYRSQCQELEAKCCQIQSKLLSLLKEIEQSSKQPSAICGQSVSDQGIICSDSVKLLIQRLLEDKSLDIPLSWKEGNKSSRSEERKNSKYECDDLGFYIVNEDDKLSKRKTSPVDYMLSKFQDNENISLATVKNSNETINNYLDEVSDSKQNMQRYLSVDAAKNDETKWHIKWDYFIKDFDQIDLRKSKDFKLLLRSGVPQEYRCKIWKALIDLRVGQERQRFGPEYYQSLLEPNRRSKSLNPASKQIELDLLRTLPNNRHFDTLDSSGTVRLRRILTAYSEHKPEVGYCQGMNRLAAVALLVLPEEEAFWCLTTIIDNIMPPGYYNDLWLAQVDSSVVMEFVSTKMPNLSNHFERNDIDLSLFAWFLTIFVDGTPPALFLRLWDSFLYEGDKILFRAALALLKMYETQLLELNNSVAINNFLRSAVNAPLDLDNFFDIAYNWMNPFSTKSLRSKRQQSLEHMRSNFEKREPFVKLSPTSSMNGDKIDDSHYDDSSIISI